MNKQRNQLDGWHRIFVVLAVVWFAVTAVVCIQEGPNFSRYEMREYRAAFHNLLGYPSDETVEGELLLFLMQNTSVDERIQEMSRRTAIVLGSAEPRELDTWFKPLPEALKKQQVSWASSWNYSAQLIDRERNNIALSWAKHVGMFAGLMWLIPLALLYSFGLLISWIRKGFGTR